MPRPEYGPKTYAVETSSDGSSWLERGRAFAASESLATTTTFTAPVSARYVRVVVSDAYDPLVSPPRGVQVAELEVLQEAASPTRRAFADTADAPYEAAAMIDANAATQWVSQQPGPSSISPVKAGIDLGAVFPVSSVTVTPRSEYGPKDYAVETSVDGSTWTQRATVTGAAQRSATTSTFAAANARYVRVVVTDAYDPLASPPRGVQIAELDVATGARYFADTSVSGFEPELMGDGDARTHWVSDSAPSARSPVAFGVDQGAARSVVGVRVVPRAEYGPKTYVVETSSDGLSWVERGRALVASELLATTTTFTAPVAARYVRVVVADAYDPLVSPPRGVQVAELEVLLEAASPTRRAFADTSDAPYEAASMIDGNAATYWVSQLSWPSSVAPVKAGVDLGAVFPVSALTVTPRSEYGPKDYAVETSVDGSTWTQRATVTGAAQRSATTSTFAVANARYVRVVVTDAYDPVASPPRGVQIAELEVTAGARYFADTSASGFGPGLMGDGDARTFWVSNSAPSARSPVAFGIDHGAATSIAGVVVTPRPDYGPKAYAVETSADGLSWSQRATVSNAAARAATTTTFSAVSARYVRVVVTDAYDPVVSPPRGVQVAELAVVP